MEMESRHIDALRRIGQADAAWTEAGHEPETFILHHTGGMQREILHPRWDPQWSVPSEQTIDDLGEENLLRVVPPHNKQRKFDLTTTGREMARRMQAGASPSRPNAMPANLQQSAEEAELDALLFFSQIGTETFASKDLADAIRNPKIDAFSAQRALRRYADDGKVRQHGRGWKVTTDDDSSEERFHFRVLPVEANEQLDGPLYGFDLSREEVINTLIRPFQAGAPISFDGREVRSYRLPTIARTRLPGKATVEEIRDNLTQDGGNPDQAEELFFDKAVKDATDDFIAADEAAVLTLNTPTESDDLAADSGIAREAGAGPIFVVHGHQQKAEVALFINNVTGVRTVILEDQAGQGRAMIEKFEQESADSSYAVVLLTADDVGGPTGTSPDGLKPRARQNAIFELGYFIAKLGRGRVVALYDDRVELPSDYKGIEYIDLSQEWRMKLIKELRAAGFEIDPDGF